MNWQKLYSQQRTGVSEDKSGPRTEFQRDFDRIIFSSPFRRLQNKTQVFPLPGSVFVHNRLTHSLEVASVGRSLGKICGQSIVANAKHWTNDEQGFYLYNLSEVLAAACLAHDIGNPAFGHSGEDAISHYFKEHGEIQKKFNIPQEIWSDFTAFEGNANAIRILTRQFPGKMSGGFRLTYTTLASIIKYPCESSSVNKAFKHRKKYGFFQPEKELVQHIYQTFEIKPEQNSCIYPRHPFVYLVEAADDICYQIIDFEDACRLKILSVADVTKLFLALIERFLKNDLHSTLHTLESIGDPNEKVSFLRSKAINALALASSEVFIENQEAILAGNWNSTLMDVLENQSDALREIKQISEQNIYSHPSVLEIEVTGFEVMSKLLDLFIGAAQKENKTSREKIILKLIPSQFGTFDEKTPFSDQIYQILDYVSGMTDLYAMELFRKIQGIELTKYR